MTTPTPGQPDPEKPIVPEGASTEEILENMAGGRVYAPTGCMRYVVIALLGLIILVMVVGFAALDVIDLFD